MWTTIITLLFLVLSLGRLLRCMVGSSQTFPLSESDFTKSLKTSTNGHSPSKTSSTASEILKRKYQSGSERYASSARRR